METDELPRQYPAPQIVLFFVYAYLFFSFHLYVWLSFRSLAEAVPRRVCIASAPVGAGIAVFIPRTVT